MFNGILGVFSENLEMEDNHYSCGAAVRLGTQLEIGKVTFGGNEHNIEADFEREYMV